MLETFVEGVKFVGGLGGLASSVFLVYDRVFRCQPLMHLLVKDKDVFLRIKNVVDETIVIRKLMMTPAVAGFAPGDSLRDTISGVLSAASGRDFLVIDPLKDRELGLILIEEKLKQLADEYELVISATWANTRRPLPFKRTLRLKTSVCDRKELYRSASPA
jgi:hypothetical protein